MTKRIFFLIAALAMAGAARADDYSAEMLAIGVGARALGMGGAFVAVANDATAAYWNPAGLTYVRTMEISTIHRTEGTRALSDVGYDYVNWAVNLGKMGAWGASYVLHTVGGIPRTFEDLGAGLGEKPYYQDGVFEAQENALLFSGGFRLAEYMAIGLTGKYLWSKIDVAKATGFSADVGALIRPWKKFSVGINAQDIAGSLAWSGTPTNPKYSIPVNVKVGMAFHQRIKRHLVGLSFDVDTKYNPILHYGVEYWYADLAALRAGLIDRGPSFKIEDKDTSLGCGVKLYVVTLDYAFVDYELVDAHYFSVTAKF